MPRNPSKNREIPWRLFPSQHSLNHVMAGEWNMGVGLSLEQELWGPPEEPEFHGSWVNS